MLFKRTSDTSDATAAAIASAAAWREADATAKRTGSTADYLKSVDAWWDCRDACKREEAAIQAAGKGGRK